MAIIHPYSLPQIIAIMSEANMLMTPIIRKVTANAHCLYSNSVGGVLCGKTASISELKDMVFSGVADCLPRLRTMFANIKPTAANRTIRIIISDISQTVYMITKIVPIKQMAQAKAANLTWVGMGLSGVGVDPAALSNKSQRALNMKKPPNLIL